MTEAYNSARRVNHPRRAFPAVCHFKAVSKQMSPNESESVTMSLG